MPSYRLSYPANVVVSVEADTKEEAKGKFVELMNDFLPDVDLGGDLPRVYLDEHDKLGGLDLDKIEVADVETTTPRRTDHAL